MLGLSSRVQQLPAVCVQRQVSEVRVVAIFTNQNQQ